MGAGGRPETRSQWAGNTSFRAPRSCHPPREAFEACPLPTSLSDTAAIAESAKHVIKDSVNMSVTAFYIDCMWKWQYFGYTGVK